MSETTTGGAADALELLVGEWSMTAGFTPNLAAVPRARTTFEWLTGRRFLVQRWELDHPNAPDGIAIIGFDTGMATYLQHYFDSRGVARVYEMSLEDKVWTLQRFAPQPDFSQRFIGSFSASANTIDGRWEISRDGSQWTLDFDLTYERVI